MKISRLAVILLLLTTLSGASFAGITSIYYKGGMLSMDQPDVNISQIYGMRISPRNISLDTKDKEIYIYHRLENLSNATNIGSIKAELADPQSKWMAELIADENGDEKHGWFENKRLEKSWKLGEGAEVGFFLKIKAPAGAKAGDYCSVVVKTSSVYKDGAGYKGYNGIIYGGPDQSVSTDTVKLK